MPASVIPVTGINEGFVGCISNEGYSLRTPRPVTPTDTLNIAYGESLVLIAATNTYSSVAQFILNGGTLTSATPVGVAVANTATNGNFPLSGTLGANTPGGYFAPGQVCDGLTQGTIDVYCRVGTPAGAGVGVYIRTALNGSIPAGVVGGFEAQADGSNTVLMTNLVWKTGKFVTANGVAQLTVLSRQIP